MPCAARIAAPARKGATRSARRKRRCRCRSCRGLISSGCADRAADSYRSTQQVDQHIDRPPTPGGGSGSPDSPAAATLPPPGGRGRGSEKTLSVTTTPPISSAMPSPMVVTIGMAALRGAWRPATGTTPRPLARAVRMWTSSSISQHGGARHARPATAGVAQRRGFRHGSTGAAARAASALGDGHGSPAPAATAA